MPGCRPAAVFPSARRRVQIPAAEGGKKALALPRRKSPASGNGGNLASCDKAAATAAPFALSLGGKYFHRPLDKGQGV